MIVPTRHCDILGRRATERKPVRKVRILVQVFQQMPPDQEGKTVPVDLDDPDHWPTERMVGPADMCPDALKRAIKFAERAVSPTNIAATKAAEATATDGKAAGGAS